MDLVQPTRFPVTHKAVTFDIKGNKTEIIICKYDDRFLVIVTQIGCMGTILHARKEESVSTDPTYSVSVIFGKRDEPWLLACARQLIEHISGSGSSRHLVLSLGLKDHSPEHLFRYQDRSYTNKTRTMWFAMIGTLKDVAQAVIENRLW